MNLYNEISGGRWNRLLQRKFNVRGDGAPQLSPDVQASATLFGDRPENRYLASEQLVGATSPQAAVGGQQSMCTLNNPTGSNRMIVVERILITPGVQGNHEIRIGFVPMAGTVDNPANRDLRWGQPGAVIGRGIVGNPNHSTSAAPVTQVGVLWFGNVITANSEWINLDVCLPPTSCLQVLATAVNQGLTVNWLWYEFALETTET